MASVKKADALRHWRSLDGTANPLAHMTPILPKSTGSRYGACGIRIDGNPAFIDAVLGKLKEVLAGENNITRLELARRDVAPVFDKHFENADTDAQVCYIRLHMRTVEGAAASAFFDRDLHAASHQYAAAIGVAEE